METIHKLGNNTYLKGHFEMRNPSDNWGEPIEFPTIFTAFGAAIRSGNWQSCTNINTPTYVIDNYLNGKPGKYKQFWDKVKELESLNQYPAKEKEIVNLIGQANYLLNQMPEL